LTLEVGRIRAENEALSRKCSELETELASVVPERDDYQDTVDALLSDCDRYLKRIKELEGKLLTPEKRNRILAALGVGKQSAQYKKVKAVLDQMMP
jgi:septal ring factor EnvC (AmiA/AmiB activator)